MSAFGNLFSMESNQTTEIQTFADSFNVTDTNNIATSSVDTLSNALNTSISFNEPGAIEKMMPYLAIGVIAALVIYAFARR